MKLNNRSTLSEAQNQKTQNQKTQIEESIILTDNIDLDVTGFSVFLSMSINLSRRFNRETTSSLRQLDIPKPSVF